MVTLGFTDLRYVLPEDISPEEVEVMEMGLSASLAPLHNQLEVVLETFCQVTKENATAVQVRGT